MLARISKVINPVKGIRTVVVRGSDFYSVMGCGVSHSGNLVCLVGPEGPLIGLVQQGIDSADQVAIRAIHCLKD
tara:strand:- start:36 stop:257 length:222 start_codon:yes stop_codon:yes gene_type:complete